MLNFRVWFWGKEIKMGKYDNYKNTKNIIIAQKKLDRLKRKRRPDLFAIQLAQQELDAANLFKTCQVFKSGSSGRAPNEDIMFSDDNRVMWFVNTVIPYDDIASYVITENLIEKAYTTTKSKGAISRALVGGVIAGGVGAVVGAASAGSKSNTTFYTKGDGFFLQIFLKNGTNYQCPIESTGVVSNKIHPLWLMLCEKLQMIIDGKV